MSNPQAYVNHPLNNSITKQTFSFSRAQRFLIQKRHTSDSMYELPSCKSGRACSFGYGTKINFVQKQKSPPPGSYQSQTDFKKATKYNTISFSMGRNKIKFGSFLSDADSKKNQPSPNAYRIKTSFYYSKTGGKMAAKLPTQIDMVTKKKTPGPGTYKLAITQLKTSGSYILSDYKNQISPKYQSPQHRNRSRSPDNITSSLGPGTYDTQHQKFGQSLISKFKNSITSSFGHSVRPGLEDKSKKYNPGFKYKKFSEFAGNEI